MHRELLHSTCSVSDATSLSHSEKDSDVGLTGSQAPEATVPKHRPRILQSLPTLYGSPKSTT